MDEKAEHNAAYSAIVLGAGPVGAALALTLAKQNWHVRLIEQSPCVDGLPPSYDHRQLALTPPSVALLEGLCGRDTLRKKLTPILQIHSSSYGELGSLNMSAGEMGVDALGYTITQVDLGQLLFAEMTQHPNIQFLKGCQPVCLEMLDELVRFSCQSDDQQVVAEADFLFAADGANSWTRDVLGFEVRKQTYPHLLMTAVATLQCPHHGLAIERFTAHGPTALLPMANPLQAKLVYCYDASFAQEVQALQAEQLIDVVNQVLGPALPTIVDLQYRQDYPLQEIRVAQIQSGHCMLLGNAAHTQHPVAGQGLNLGLRDVLAVQQWVENGADKVLWQALAQRRLQDYQQTMNFTDGLVKMFTHPKPLVRQAVALGLTLLDACQPLKRRITRMAMGY